uniref:Uncharacterized protein n=1 Tax=Arundo donax TaxID=35708 RepID=A0A0A9FKX7_ARUDO
MLLLDSVERGGN